MPGGRVSRELEVVGFARGDFRIALTDSFTPRLRDLYLAAMISQVSIARISYAQGISA